MGFRKEAVLERMNTDAKPRRLADGDDLDSFVDAHEIALVEFYTKGCSKCHAMEPVLGNVARATDVTVGMVNPGDDIGLVERFDIQSVPTLVVFRDGEVVGKKSDGFQGAQAVIDFLSEHAPRAADTLA